MSIRRGIEMSPMRLTALLQVMSLVLLIGVSGPATAQMEQEGVWDWLRAEVAGEGAKMQEVIESQTQTEAADQALKEQLDHSRRLRAMYREAVFLSELNIAWIYDQLDHWDCRVAEQKQLELQSRRTELAAFAERVGALCGELGTQDNSQHKACTGQQQQIERTLAQLNDLSGRYASACVSQSNQFQTKGDQPWR